MNEGENMERLADVKPPVENKIEYLRELASGFETGQIFLTALELDIFSKLQESQSAEKLAGELETDPDLTGRFLDVLTAMRLLAKNHDQYHTAPETAPFLMEGSPFFARYLMFGIRSRETWLNLKEILKKGPTGEPDKHEHDYDQQCIDWMARGTMLGRLQATVRQVRDLPEFSRARKLIDLGGGHGLFGIAFAQENPELDVVIFDKPEVTPMTQVYIDRYGMADRIHTISGDYTKDTLGTDYDIAFEACSFAGDENGSRAFFSKVCNALKDNGLFIRLTFTLDDNRSGPISSLVWDLKDHLTGHSHMPMRTNSELFQLLQEAGLTGERVIDMSPWCSMPMRLIISRKTRIFPGNSTGSIRTEC